MQREREETKRKEKAKIRGRLLSVQCGCCPKNITAPYGAVEYPLLDTKRERPSKTEAARSFQEALLLHDFSPLFSQLPLLIYFKLLYGFPGQLSKPPPMYIELSWSRVWWTWVNGGFGFFERMKGGLDWSVPGDVFWFDILTVFSLVFLSSLLPFLSSHPFLSYQPLVRLNRPLINGIRCPFFVGWDGGLGVELEVSKAWWENSQS